MAFLTVEPGTVLSTAVSNVDAARLSELNSSADTPSRTAAGKVRWNVGAGDGRGVGTGVGPTSPLGQLPHGCRANYAKRVQVAVVGPPWSFPQE